MANSYANNPQNTQQNTNKPQGNISGSELQNEQQIFNPIDAGN
jgi:hypothetical protein